MDKIQTLMTKYLQVLGSAAGKEMDNIRAKMAWSLVQDFFLTMPTMPASLQELAVALDDMLKSQFPFCDTLDINEIPSGEIVVSVKQCVIKEANQDLLRKSGVNLCPVAPFFIFAFSRSFSRNAWLADSKATEQGCLLHFSLGNCCSCRQE